VAEQQAGLAPSKAGKKAKPGYTSGCMIYTSIVRCVPGTKLRLNRFYLTKSKCSQGTRREEESGGEAGRARAHQGREEGFFQETGEGGSEPRNQARHPPEREFFIDNLLVQIHFIIVMIRWTGPAPWEFESPFPGSLTSTFLDLPPTLPTEGCCSVKGFAAETLPPPVD